MGERDKIADPFRADRIADHQHGSSGTLDMQLCTISDNEAETNGGAISVLAGGMTLGIKSSSIIGNSAGADGGGVYHPFFNAGLVNFADSLFDGNDAGRDGGGIYGTIDGLSVSIVSGNDAGRDGGGAFSLGGILGFQLAFVGNDAGRDGGGAWIGGGSTAVDNMTVSGNTAVGRDGGIFSDDIGSAVPLSFVTIADNGAASGGGLIVDNIPPTFFASIIADSRGGGNCSGAPASTGFNFSDDATCAGGFTQSSDRNGVDPLLGVLTSTSFGFSFPTQVHPLLVGSPAIDHVTSGCVGPDQRGVVRPQGPACDSGAFEREPSAEIATGPAAAAPSNGGPAKSAAGPSPPEGKDDEPNVRRRSEEQRQQKQRTDRSGLDDTRTEGNVTGVRCDEDPPWVTFANRDGEVKVLLLYETKTQCRAIRVGDYLEASGEKVHEQLFEAHDATVTRGGRRVR